MMTFIFWLFFTTFLMKVNAQNSQQYQQLNFQIQPSNLDNESYDIETSEMVELLKKINSEGNPHMYYHWNKKMAKFYKKRLRVSSKMNRYKIWTRYCYQLLLAGENQLCINEIEKKIKNNKTSYETLILVSLPVMETLGLAYLRLGEELNCTNNHNEFSCILPLAEEGFHISKKGSKKAIEIFSKIYSIYPKQKYKWLLNLAHMTLGDYPDRVPDEYFIDFYKNIEDKNVAPFREIASYLGIDVNGLSGGVSLDDFNNDGLTDIFATSYGMEDQSRLFINTGEGFKDSTSEAGLNGILGGLNCIHADYLSLIHI